MKTSNLTSTHNHALAHGTPAHNSALHTSPNLRSATKPASASIYVVIFTTIILSIISLSFLRIVLSETAQTTDNELSQSAYDSALAGIEDAKIALLKYHDCLSRGKDQSGTFTEECKHIVETMEEFIQKDSCDTIAAVLKRPIRDSGSVMIDSSTDLDKADGDGVSKVLDQAYTCVKVKTKVNNYLAYLDRENRSRIVPLRAIHKTDKRPLKIESIKLQWHSASRLDENSKNPLRKNMKMHGPGLEPNPSEVEAFRPPMLKLQLVQAGNTFTLHDFNINNGDKRTGRATLLLKPTNGVSQDSNLISARTLALSADLNDNTVNEVSCKVDKIALGTDSPFMCEVDINLPLPFRGEERAHSSSLLRISMPYAATSTDFSIGLCESKDGKDCDNSEFAGVQAVVDSTGRAANFYRRIESRIELIDSSFPYPDYAIDAPKSELNKDFYVTRNCWTEEGTCDNNGRDPDL